MVVLGVDIRGGGGCAHGGEMGTRSREVVIRSADICVRLYVKGINESSSINLKRSVRQRSRIPTTVPHREKGTNTSV